MTEPNRCDIDRFLRWLEETDRELIELYERARFVGILARVLHGKFAIVPRGRP